MEYSVLSGWQCPVCGIVNAIWVAQCPGYHGPTTINSATTTPEDMQRIANKLFLEYDGAWQTLSTK